MHRPVNATRTPSLLVLATFAVTTFIASSASAEWTHWRGPNQNGTAPDKGLIATWSKDGENLLWRADFTGRSTPAVFDQRVCAIGRVGEDISRQEIVACWNADTGKRLWEHRHTVHNTDVPWNRVGWAGVAGDSETGYLIAHTVDGFLFAFDRDGGIVWQHNMHQDYGRLSGYGGRTHTPIIDGDLVLLGAISASWGEQKPPRHRFFAFDKRTGDIVYVSTPSGPPAGDLNTQSTPVVASIGGQRLLIGGAADGFVHAIQASTGKPVWKFRLSKRGLNASVVVSGDTVFASHSEENLTSGTMGAAVAIDGTGQGDVSATHEKWRIPELAGGFPSPLFHDGTVYIADNSANLHAVDAATGAVRWTHGYGTVGKSSPVWADGKIYLTEVNGNVQIIEPGAEGATVLDDEHLSMPDGRYAEIYASPAVAYGRIYFTTEEGIYCLGGQAAAAKPAPAPRADSAAAGPLAQVLVVPAEIVTYSDREVELHVRGFDAHGRQVDVDAGNVRWSLDGLSGAVDAQGRVRFEAAAGTQLGAVVATVGEVSGRARARVAGSLPWTEDFEGIEDGTLPASWLPSFKGAHVQTVEGEGKILVQPKASRGAPRAFAYFGPSDMDGYTVQADIKGNRVGRRMTDLGVISGGYTFDVQGAHQRVQIRSWSSERRMMKQADFAWEVGVWYTIKLTVERNTGGKTLVRGKVWKRGEPEPAAWTLEAEDPLEIASGSPGLYTFAPVESYFDNIKVTVNP